MKDYPVRMVFDCACRINPTTGHYLRCYEMRRCQLFLERMLQINHHQWHQ
jgi:hypothetical protein